MLTWSRNSGTLEWMLISLHSKSRSSSDERQRSNPAESPYQPHETCVTCLFSADYTWNRVTWMTRTLDCLIWLWNWCFSGRIFSCPHNMKLCRSFFEPIFCCYHKPKSTMTLLSTIATTGQSRNTLTHRYSTRGAQLPASSDGACNHIFYVTMLQLHLLERHTP